MTFDPTQPYKNIDGVNINLTADEISAIAAEQATNASLISAAQLKQSARAALDKTDTTIIRCYSAGAAVPSEWQSYRTALRAIFNGTDTISTSLPTQPSYPANT